jgi:hypothetical protein
MSERYAVELAIGGTLPRSKLPVLLEVICSEGWSDTWDGDHFQPTQEQDLQTVVDQWLILYDPRRRNGDMGRIGAVLRDLGLSYRYHCEGGEYDPLLTIYDATSGLAEQDYWCDCQGRPMLPREAVKELWDEIVGCMPFDATRSSLSPSEIREAMLELLGPDIPELPLFKLAGGLPPKAQTKGTSISVAAALLDQAAAELLDERVADVFSERASALNNQGVEAQLEFLKAEYGDAFFQVMVQDLMNGSCQEVEAEEDDGLDEEDQYEL